MVELHDGFSVAVRSVCALHVTASSVEVCGAPMHEGDQLEPLHVPGLQRQFEVIEKCGGNANTSRLGIGHNGMKHGNGGRRPRWRRLV